MKLYPLGAVTPRFTTISSSTNATPIVITTSAPHGLLVTDVITIVNHSTNTAANGTYQNGVTFQTGFSLTPTTITLTGRAGNGVGGATGSASAPQQLISASSFPVIPGVTDNSKLLVARILVTAVPKVILPTGTVYVGTAGLNQGSFTNLFRGINPPPAAGIYDYYDVEIDGTNVIPIADYWVDNSAPATDGALVAFWIR